MCGAGWGHSSMAKRLSGIHKTLGLLPAKEHCEHLERILFRFFFFCFGVFFFVLFCL